MRMMLGLVVAVATQAIAAVDTPATVWFHEDAPTVSDRLANLCANRSGIVAEQDDRHVLCTKEATGLRGALAQVLIGNSYSTTPELHVRFAIMKDGPATRVQASQWIETQMAFGQVRREPMNGSKQVDQIDGILRDIGATTTPPELWPAPPPPPPPPPMAPRPERPPGPIDPSELSRPN